MDMDRDVFGALCALIYETSGITLNDKKGALVSARIGKRMRALGIDCHGDYLRHVRKDETGAEVVELIDAISTNVTHFFRERVHFDVLAAEMKNRLAAGQRRFRFWSAGCSSGEEPYSLAVTLMETPGAAAADLRILATDISTRMLRRSMAGVYDGKRIEDVPAALRERYFEKEGSKQEARYRARETLRRLIVFNRLNLSVVPFPMSGPMDAIFCRNVMIYFDNAVRKKLLAEFNRLLKPGGYLFVGHAESLTGMLSGFKVVQPSVYVKP